MVASVTGEGRGGAASAMADRMMMERTFSMPRKEPAEILQEESDEEGER